MLKIGCHLSISKGFLNMGKETVKLGGNCFQFFSRNPRGGSSKAWDDKDIEAYIAFAKEHGLAEPLAHAPYTLNACAADEGLRVYAFDTMKDDLQKLEAIPNCRYNFHPGSHVKQGAETGIVKIADILNRLETAGYHTTVLLETMAGKGSEVGRNFEELRAVIDLLEDSSNIGICLDTCHVYDGGYDIVNDLDGVLKQFDDILGLERLKALHLNDSMNPMGSHKDRHQKIGEGSIGTDAFARIINHEKLQGIPCYLETPNELPGYAREIALLKSLYHQE